MVIVDELRALDKSQRSAFVAALMGWALDAFDFFILTFVFKDIASEFGVTVKAVSYALTVTLVMRPVGAFVFGWLADRFGRRPVLMFDVGLYATVAFASAFAPNLTTLLILRGVFGFAMGGEWGIGASLVMESIPAKSRGVVSGILQEGYPIGYFIAAIANLFLPQLGWRGMMMLGVAPALLILFVRRHVHESPGWQAARDARRAKGIRGTFLPALRHGWKRFLFMVVLMTAFNFFSHGSQDLYPTFLRVQHHFAPVLVSVLTMVLNVGAICGGLIFGGLSQKIGRRKAIVIACALALPAIPFWAFSATPLMLGFGAFMIQVAVQGAWGVVPVHLNELAPAEARGTFPGLTYQLGNLFAALSAPWQTEFAEAHGNNYGLFMAALIAIVAVVIAVIVSLGPEARGVSMAGGPDPIPEPAQ
jgi:SHS family lactate transporter-like MFS transporter